MAATLLACDRCIAAAVVNDVHYVYGQLGETDPVCLALAVRSSRMVRAHARVIEQGIQAAIAMKLGGAA